MIDAAKREAHIRQWIDEAPPLTPERAARLRGLLFTPVARSQAAAEKTLPRKGNRAPRKTSAGAGDSRAS